MVPFPLLSSRTKCLKQPDNIYKEAQCPRLHPTQQITWYTKVFVFPVVDAHGYASLPLIPVKPGAFQYLTRYFVVKSLTVTKPCYLYLQFFDQSDTIFQITNLESSRYHKIFRRIICLETGPGQWCLDDIVVLIPPKSIGCNDTYSPSRNYWKSSMGIHSKRIFFLLLSMWQTLWRRRRERSVNISWHTDDYIQQGTQYYWCR